MNSLEAMLARIPGVDYETAIKRMSDNAAFYAELLRLFFKDDPSKKLAAVMERGDYINAAYEAHSIKGTAANIGLTEISLIASKIHLCLKKGDTKQAKAMLAELEQACKPVCSAIYQLNGGTADERTK